MAAEQAAGDRTSAATGEEEAHRRLPQEGAHQRQQQHSHHRTESPPSVVAAFTANPSHAVGSRPAVLFSAATHASSAATQQQAPYVVKELTATEAQPPPDQAEATAAAVAAAIKKEWEARIRAPGAAEGPPQSPPGCFPADASPSAAAAESFTRLQLHLQQERQRQLQQQSQHVQHVQQQHRLRQQQHQQLQRQQLEKGLEKQLQLQQQEPRRYHSPDAYPAVSVSCAPSAEVGMQQEEEQLQQRQQQQHAAQGHAVDLLSAPERSSFVTVGRLSSRSSSQPPTTHSSGKVRTVRSNSSARRRLSAEPAEQQQQRCGVLSPPPTGRRTQQQRQQQIRQPQRLAGDGAGKAGDVATCFHRSPYFAEQQRRDDISRQQRQQQQRNETQQLTQQQRAMGIQQPLAGQVFPPPPAAPIGPAFATLAHPSSNAPAASKALGLVSPARASPRQEASQPPALTEEQQRNLQQQQQPMHLGYPLQQQRRLPQEGEQRRYREQEARGQQHLQVETQFRSPTEEAPFPAHRRPSDTQHAADPSVNVASVLAAPRADMGSPDIPGSSPAPAVTAPASGTSSSSAVDLEAAPPSTATAKTLRRSPRRIFRSSAFLSTQEQPASALPAQQHQRHPARAAGVSPAATAEAPEEQWRTVSPTPSLIRGAAAAAPRTPAVLQTTAGEGGDSPWMTSPYRVTPRPAAVWSPSDAAFPLSAPAAPAGAATSSSTRLLLLSSRLPLRPPTPVAAAPAAAGPAGKQTEYHAGYYDCRRRRRHQLPFGAHRVCSLEPQRATPPKLSALEQHLLSLTCNSGRSPHVRTPTAFPERSFAQPLPHRSNGSSSTAHRSSSYLPFEGGGRGTFYNGACSAYSSSSPPFSSSSSNAPPDERVQLPRSTTPTSGQGGRWRKGAGAAAGAESSATGEAPAAEVAAAGRTLPMAAARAAARNVSESVAEVVGGARAIPLTPVYLQHQQQRAKELSHFVASSAAPAGIPTGSTADQSTPVPFTAADPYYLAAVREASDIIVELEERLARKEMLYDGELLLQEGCIAYQRESIRLLQQEIQHLQEAVQEKEYNCVQAQREVVLLLKHLQLLRSMRGGDVHSQKLWEDLQELYFQLKTARERGFLPPTASRPLSPAPSPAPPPPSLSLSFPDVSVGSPAAAAQPSFYSGSAGAVSRLPPEGAAPVPEAAEWRGRKKEEAEEEEEKGRSEAKPVLRFGEGAPVSELLVRAAEPAGVPAGSPAVSAGGDERSRRVDQQQLVALQQQLRQLTAEGGAAIEAEEEKKQQQQRDRELGAAPTQEEQQQRLQRLRELIREATNPYPFISDGAATAATADAVAAEELGPAGEAGQPLQQLPHRTLPRSALPPTAVPVAGAGIGAAATLGWEQRVPLPSKEEREENERLLAANEQLRIRCTQLAAQVTCLRLAGTGLTKDQTDYVNRQLEELRAYCETLEKQNRDLAAAAERALREQERELQQEYKKLSEEAAARHTETAAGLRADAAQQTKQIGELQSRLAAAEQMKEDALAELLRAERRRDETEKRLNAQHAAAAAQASAAQQSLAQKVSQLQQQLQQQQEQQKEVADREAVLRRQYEEVATELRERTRELELLHKQRQQQELQLQEGRQQQELQQERQEHQRQIRRLQQERQRLCELLAKAEAAGLFRKQAAATRDAAAAADQEWDDNLEQQLEIVVSHMRTLHQQHEETLQHQKELQRQQQLALEKQRQELLQQQQRALEQQKQELLQQQQRALEKQRQEMQQPQRAIEQERQELKEQQRALEQKKQKLQQQLSALEQQRQAAQEEQKLAMERLEQEARLQQAVEASRARGGDEHVVELEKHVERLQQAKQQLEQQLSRLSERSAQQHFEREKVLQKTLQEKDMLKQTLVRIAADSDKLQNRYDEEMQQRIQKHKEELQQREQVYEGKLRSAAASTSELLKRSDTMEKQHLEEVATLKRQHEAELLALQEARLRDIERHKHEVVAAHQRRRTSMEGLQKKHDSEMELLKQQSQEALQACAERFEQQLERQRLQHATELQHLRVQHGSELQQQQQRFQETLEQHQQEFSHRLDHVKTRGDTAVAELQRRNTAELQEVKQQLQKITVERLNSEEELRTQTAKDKQEAEQKHKKAMELLRLTHQKETENLRKEIKRLQQELSAASSAAPSEREAAASAAAHAARFRRAVGNSVEALQQEIERIMRRLEEMRAHSTKLETEKGNLLSERRELDRQLQAEGEHRRRQDTQLRNLEAQHQQLQKEVQMQRAQADSLRASLDAATAEAAKWKKLAQAAGQHEEKSRAADQAQEQLTRMQLQATAQIGFIKSLKEQLATKEKVLAQLEGEVAELHRELRAKELKDIHTVSELRKQSLYLEHSKDDAQATVARLKTANQQLQQENADLAAKVKSLTEEAEAARQRATAAAAAAAAASRSRGDTSSRGSRDGAALRESLSHLEQQLLLVEQQLQQQRKIESRLREEVHMLQGQIEVKEKQNGDYKWQLRQMAETVSETNRRLRSHLTGFSEEKAALQNKLEKNFAAREEALLSQLRHTEERLAAAVAPLDERTQRQQQHRIQELSHLVEQLLLQRGAAPVEATAAQVTTTRAVPVSAPQEVLLALQQQPQGGRSCLSQGSAASSGSAAATILLPAATAAGLQRCMQHMLEAMPPLLHVTGEGEAAAAIVLCMYPILPVDLLAKHLLLLKPWVAGSLLLRLLQQLVSPEQALLLLQQAKQRQMQGKKTLKKQAEQRRKKQATSADEEEEEQAQEEEGEQETPGDKAEGEDETEQQQDEGEVGASRAAQEDIAAAFGEAHQLQKEIQLLCQEKENVEDEQIALLFHKIESFCGRSDPLEGVLLLQAMAAAAPRDDVLRLLQQLLNAGAPRETAAAVVWHVWGSGGEVLHQVEQCMQADFTKFFAEYIYGAGATRTLLLLLKEALIQIRELYRCAAVEETSREPSLSPASFLPPSAGVAGLLSPSSTIAPAAALPLNAATPAFWQWPGSSTPTHLRPPSAAGDSAAAAAFPSSPAVPAPSGAAAPSGVPRSKTAAAAAADQTVVTASKTLAAATTASSPCPPISSAGRGSHINREKEGLSTDATTIATASAPVAHLSSTQQQRSSPGCVLPVVPPQITTKKSNAYLPSQPIEAALLPPSRTQPLQPIGDAFRHAAAATSSGALPRKASAPPRYRSEAAATEEPEEADEGVGRGGEWDVPQARQPAQTERAPARAGPKQAAEGTQPEGADFYAEKDFVSPQSPAHYFAEAFVDQLLPAAATPGGQRCLNVSARLKYKLRGRVVKASPAAAAPPPARRRFPTAAGSAAAAPWRHAHMQRIPPRCSSN